MSSKIGRATSPRNSRRLLHDRVTLLTENGPNLKRPVVGEIKSSRHKNMKELIVSAAGSLRVLFALDPRRHAILLLGGDKTSGWDAWYATAVPHADDLSDQHLQELRDGSLDE